MSRRAAPPPGAEPGNILDAPLDETLLIEASAGTGKTHAITNLYLRLLLESGRTADQILVVTFTRAATADLRTRIRRRIHEMLDALDRAAGGADALEGLDDDLATLVKRRTDLGGVAEDRGRLLRALHGFDQSAVFTIQSFCQRMLRENAFESGTPFDVELLADESLLVDQVSKDFWIRSLHDAPREFIDYVSEMGLKRLKAVAQVLQEHPRIEAVHEAPRDENMRRWLEMQIDPEKGIGALLRQRKRSLRQQSYRDELERMATALKGDSGKLLAERIRARLPVALIDEFQDTDPQQYEIFRTIYHDGGLPLFLIGDPKQAIYSFRGADVFAYLAARDDAKSRRTLRTNWRSDKNLIAALNTLFGTGHAFLLDAIRFEAALPKKENRLEDKRPDRAPFEILFLESSTDKAMGKGAVKRQLPQLVAGEILALVRSGATIEGRPLTFGDVAVLCRKNVQLAQIQQALRALGVPSSLQNETSVYDTEEAAEVARVLAALADPLDSSAVRSALATHLLGQPLSALVALQSDEQAWDTWLRKFREWNGTWREKGFMTAFRRMLDGEKVAPRLLGWIDGERRLTNVLQLSELLHTAAVGKRLGPEGLVHWLSEARKDESARSADIPEAAQIRLESDDSAVKLLTVHKSKGLEYPVVFCPYLWDGGDLSKSDKKLPRFHDRNDGWKHKVDLGPTPSKDPDSLARTEEERFEEDLRLLYVALTRARHRCCVVWGPINQSEKSALAHVLHAPADGREDRAARKERVKELIDEGDNDGMREDLGNLVERSKNTIGLRLLCRDEPEPWGSAADPATRESFPGLRSARRALDLGWRTASFTSLVSAASAFGPASEGVDHDAGATPEAPEDETAAPVTLHDFPAGARAGQFLHGVFEVLDPGADDVAVQALVERKLLEEGLDAKWGPAVSLSVREVLSTPLDPPGLRLDAVDAARRLTEMRFLLPVAADGKGKLTAQRLADAFAAHALPPFSDRGAERLRRLGFADLHGFLTGSLDLAFEHDGLWYVADYKSNRLGASAAAYAPERLPREILRHNYFLQYHLYVVALHRHLARRVPGYDYDTMFGGVRYLFLRGMSPQAPPGNGIFTDRPPRALVESLDRVLKGGDPA